jgi:hypothetical protein
MKVTAFIVECLVFECNSFSLDLGLSIRPKVKRHGSFLYDLNETGVYLRPAGRPRNESGPARGKGPF